MTGTPLYRDTVALCGVLLEEIEAAAPAWERLRRRLADGALRLLDDVTLALAGFDRFEHVQDADAELQTLRSHLALALALEIVDEDSFLDLAEQADTVGRQLGGWLKKLRREVEEV